MSDDRNPQMVRRHDSPDEGVHTEPHGITQVVRNILGNASSRETILGVALGISLIVNVLAIYTWRDAATESRVKDYDLTFFVTHDFAALKSDVQVNQKLIEAYGLQKAVKDAAKEK